MLQEIKASKFTNSVNIDLLSDKKKVLESICKTKCQGHMLRLRAHWLEEGENVSKYFCNLELRNCFKQNHKTF